MRKVLTAALFAGVVLTACGRKESSVTVAVESSAAREQTEAAESWQPGGETQGEAGTQNPAGAGESVAVLDGNAPSGSENTVIEVPAEAQVSKEGPQASGQESNVPGAPLSGAEDLLSQTPGEEGTPETGESEAYGENAPLAAAEDPSEILGAVTGEVVDAAMNTVTVRSEADGQEYTFLTEEAETSLAGGLLTGSSVEILYQGVLKGTDTADVTVLLVTDNEKKTITGTVTAEAMSTLRILTEDGRELSFSKELAEIIKKEDAPGLEGCHVTLEYTGEIFDLDTTFAYVWTIIQTD